VTSERRRLSCGERSFEDHGSESVDQVAKHFQEIEVQQVVSSQPQPTAPSTANRSQRSFRGCVVVYPRREILDPQGKAIAAALARLGFSAVETVRAGKSFEVELRAADRASAEMALAEMGRRLLANPITEDFSFELEEADA
jgi:phosphoribosylformylglycinamidine synthase